MVVGRLLRWKISLLIRLGEIEVREGIGMFRVLWSAIGLAGWSF